MCKGCEARRRWIMQQAAKALGKVRGMRLIERLRRVVR